MNSTYRSLFAALLAGGLLSVAQGLVTSTPAAAASPTKLGTFNAWTAWTGTDSSGTICYIAGDPSSTKPTGLNRDPAHFLVVHRKTLGTKNETQSLLGYPIKKDSRPVATVDGKTYQMIAEGSGAWLASAADDASFVASMKKGSSLTVSATSQRGTDTTDTYSLAGVTAAMAAIDKACS